MKKHLEMKNLQRDVEEDKGKTRDGQQDPRRAENERSEVSSLRQKRSTFHRMGKAQRYPPEDPLRFFQ